MLTRRQLYELYREGPDVMARIIEDLYEHLAATEPLYFFTESMTGVVVFPGENRDVIAPHWPWGCEPTAFAR